jgi:hypothetical protein
MASFTIAVASVSGSATAPRTAARAHRVAASRVPAGSLGRGSGVAARRAAAAAAATDRPVVLIDNYDSFTYNLSQVREIPEDIARLSRTPEARLGTLHHPSRGSKARTRTERDTTVFHALHKKRFSTTFRRRATNAADDVNHIPHTRFPSSHLPRTLLVPRRPRVRPRRGEERRSDC